MPQCTHSTIKRKKEEAAKEKKKKRMNGRNDAETSMR
jgi:hypothetical protein